MDIRDVCFLLMGFTPSIIALLGYVVRIERVVATVDLRLKNIEERLG